MVDSLIKQLGNPEEVKRAMLLPSPSQSKDIRNAYEAGAVMQAGAIAMVLRGIFGPPLSDRSERQMEVKMPDPNAQCCSECNRELPTHLIDVTGDDPRYSVICACGCRYRVKEGRFYLDGKEHNPLTGKG